MLYLEALIELTELLSAEIRDERLPIQEAFAADSEKNKAGNSFCVTADDRSDERWYRNAIFGNLGAGIPERRKGTVSDRRGAGRGMSYRKTSWISGPETAGGTFAGMSGTAAASAENYKKELEEKKHMYRCLGVAAGIFVILILV